MEQAETGIRATGLFDLRIPAGNDQRELLRDRYLFRGGSLLIVGNTGVGKSSLTMQMMIKWSLGQECFGIAPTRPLKSLLIQGENDECDLTEMRDGVDRSLVLTKMQRPLINGNVLVVAECDRFGDEFVAEVLQPLLARHRLDLVWIDPLLQYLGGDVSQQNVVGEFLRHSVAPVLKQYACSAVLVHHTTKPARSIKPVSTNHNLGAYDGAGSAELGNWPRAVLSLRPTDVDGCYQLVAGKRGNKLGWLMPDGVTMSKIKNLNHSRQRGIIFCEEAPVEAVDANAGPVDQLAAANDPRDPVVEVVMQNIPADGTIDKQQLIQQVNRQSGIGVDRLRTAITTLVTAETLQVALIPRAGTKAAVHLRRAIQQPVPPPEPPVAQ